jgi:GrpB-like predicted nucleotidyltransferase (UPF0157 family)
MDADERESELRRILIHGLTPTVVKIVDYDPAWVSRFDALRDALLGRLGDRAIRVEHIGSTSVPGLGAKDRVDICLTVRDAADEPDYLADLLDLGWLLSAREPGHRALRYGEPATANLHVYADDSVEVTNYLLFRDWLRLHDDDRARYEAVKRELAGRGEWPDMNFYADAKGPFIQAILAKARS